MPVVPTTAYSQAEDALNLARSLVNDAAGVVFTDTVLMPFLNAAYRTLQRELAENGVTVLVAQADLDLPLTDGLTPTEISDSLHRSFPRIAWCRTALWEMVTGSTDMFLPMEKIAGGLPNFQPGAYLRMWEWIEDQINLIGAMQAITVRIRYEKVLPTLVYGTDPVQIRSSTDPLAYSTAAMAARSRGQRALAMDMSSAAADATLKLIERYVRPDQYKGRRRHPMAIAAASSFCRFTELCRIGHAPLEGMNDGINLCRGDPLARLASNPTADSSLQFGCRLIVNARNDTFTSGGATDEAVRVACAQCPRCHPEPGPQFGTSVRDLLFAPLENPSKGGVSTPP